MTKRWVDSLLAATVHLLSVSRERSRESSAPYISGDSFLHLADFVLDAPVAPEKLLLYPEDVFEGAIIFIRTQFLELFRKEIHPRITCRYILMTHNDDLSIPGPHITLLSDPKLLAWFGTNALDILHPKLHPIPIGLPNRSWPHGNVALFEQAKKMKHQKNHLLNLSFQVWNTNSERAELIAYFRYLSFAKIFPSQDPFSYLCNLASSYFVLSPPGFGFDCHRTWESLYMGAYPIVLSSPLNPLFEGLPIVIVDRWNQIDQHFLEKKYEEMKGIDYRWDKLDLDFWKAKLNQYRSISSASLKLPKRR